MGETVQNKNSRTKAIWLQHAANALSYSRMVAAPLLFTQIAKGNHKSWKTTGAIGLLALSDGLDGRLARKAAAIDGSVATEKGAWLDQMADKVLTHGILGGFVVHAFRAEKPGQGTILAINQAIQFTRDTWVTRVRKEAADHGISTKAQRLGKIKTSVLLGSLAALASPAAQYTYGEVVGITGVTVGSGLAVASGLSLAQNLNQEILHAGQSKGPAMPTHATDIVTPLSRSAQGDTNLEL